ncbi:unnamed protein product, partial [Meganyctiphanes norvegica]
DLIGVYKTSEGSVLRVTRVSEESLLDDTLVGEKNELKSTSEQWCNVAAIASVPEAETYPVLGYSELKPLNMLEQEIDGTGISKVFKDSVILEYGNEGSEDLEALNDLSPKEKIYSKNQFYQTEHTGLVIDHVAYSLISQTTSNKQNNLCYDKLQANKHKEIEVSGACNKDITAKILSSNPMDSNSTESFMSIKETIPGSNIEKEGHKTASTKMEPRRRRSGLAALNLSTHELDTGIAGRQSRDSQKLSEPKVNIDNSIQLLDSDSQQLWKDESGVVEEYTDNEHNKKESEEVGVTQLNLNNLSQEEHNMHVEGITNWTVGEPFPSYPIFEEGNSC